MTMKKGTYLICGRSGSGKSLLAGFLHERYSVLLYRFSHPLNTILAEMGLPNTRENLMKLSESLRLHFGEHILGVAAKKYIADHPNKTIVIEGVRRIHALEGWKDQIDEIIWIDANPQTRYQRIIERGEKSGENLLTFEAFMRQESLDAEETLLGLKNSATITIDNNGTREEFYHAIEAVFLGAIDS